MPWSEWDVLAPVGHYYIYFTSDEVRRMWEDASSDPSAPRVSRLDALLAFVWKMIIRARGLERDKELVNMAVTLGLRPRVSPPLTDAFLGSAQLAERRFPVVFHAIAGEDEREEASPSYFNIDEATEVVEYVLELLRDRLHPVCE